LSVCLDQIILFLSGASQFKPSCGVAGLCLGSLDINIGGDALRKSDSILVFLGSGSGISLRFDLFCLS
jgi:hypothetical protein